MDTMSPGGRFPAPAPIAQLAEATDLKSVWCRFESDWGYGVRGAQPRHERRDWAVTRGRLSTVISKLTPCAAGAAGSASSSSGSGSSGVCWM